MKRFHVHLHVDDLARSVGFYTKLFAAEPARLEGDYAKWMLEDPRLNFAISTRGTQAGIDHLGFQVDDSSELAELKARAQSADMALLDEGETTCCYARSEKHWVTDPQGIAWEQFHSLAGIPVFSERATAATDAPPAARPTAAAESACCASSAAAAAPVIVSAPAAPAATAGACCDAAPRGKPVSIAVKSTNNCC